MSHRLLGLTAALALVAIACGDDGDDTTTDPTTTEPPAASTTSAAVTAADDAADGPALEAAIADGWTARAIGEGTKPVLAIDPAGVPGVAFLFENLPEGFVSYATAGDDWAVDQFVEGYFYGPIGLDYDPDGRPNVAYHDHQDRTFQDNLGDLTHARLEAGEWQVVAAASDGHDGWDSTIRIGSDGIVRAAGIDPAQFGRAEGVEYYELVDGTWQIEAVGSGPIEYEWNVDLQVAPDGTPGITYFDTTALDLVYTARSLDGTWTAETVDGDGDVGRFSAFAYDAEGNAHISYWQNDAGEVRYASNVGGGWDIETIDVLANVQTGFEGARRITSIAIDSTGAPRVAYSDVTGIHLATRAADRTWSTEQIVTAGGRQLGQLVSMELDDADAVHLAFFEVSGNSPLSGVVGYVSNG